MEKERVITLTKSTEIGTQGALDTRRSLSKLIGVLNTARVQLPRVSLYMMKLGKQTTRALKTHE
jgi:hypothetical protein